MDRRSHESPMDFEWQTQGPVDVTSPFYKLTQLNGQKRGFESPSKASLEPSNSSSTFFSSSAATTAAPFRNPSFTTPRKPFDQDFFSETSGAESSPADNADSEDTPDPKVIKPVPFISWRIDKKPIFGRYGLHNSPFRNDLRRGLHVDSIQRARKRKRVDKDVAIIHRRGSVDSGSENEDVKHHGNRDEKPYRKPGWIESFFDGVQSRPQLPIVLAYYCQLLLNWTMVALVIYFLYSAYAAVRADVDKASEDAMSAAILEIASCASQFTANRCARDMRAPALEKSCLEWEICMNRDPTQVRRAQVSAHTFADIFNSFVEPISWKAIMFVVIILTMCVVVNNLAFGLLRSKVPHAQPPPFSYPPPTPHPSQEYYWNPPPQTPRHISGGKDAYALDGGPYYAILPSQTPQRSPKKGAWI